MRTDFCHLYVLEHLPEASWTPAVEQENRRSRGVAPLPNKSWPDWLGCITGRMRPVGDCLQLKPALVLVVAGLLAFEQKRRVRPASVE